MKRTPLATLLLGVFLSLPAWGELTPELRRSVPLLDTKPRGMVPGVYSLGELAPVHAYLIESEDGLVLIDTGYSGDLGRLAQAIDSLGLDPRDIAHVLVTHLHLDHWMGLDYIRSLTGAKTYMGAADAAVVERGAPPEVVVPARVVPPDLVVPPTAIDVHLEGDQRVPIAGLELYALDCSGHTPGSVCYYLETGPWRVLFGGDTIMSVRSGLGTYMAALHESLGGDIEAYRKTLLRLSKLPVNVSLPSHPYFDRRRTGNHPHPVMSSEGWRQVLQEGLADLDLIESRFSADGRDFLDERSRLLAPGLAYLGSSSEGAVYALHSRSEVCLVDPSRLAPGLLASRLAAVGLEPGAVSTVLLTTPAIGEAELLRSVSPLPDTLEVRGPAAPLTRLSAKGLAVRRVSDGERFSACGLEIETRLIQGWLPESVTYLVEVGGRLAAFTGDSLSPLTADQTIALDTGQPGWSDNLETLEALRVALWLPGRPFARQNANLYGLSWLRTLRVNRMALASKRRTR